MAHTQEKKRITPADLVRRWRALGLTPYRIAKDLGLMWRTVRNIESQERRTTRGTLLLVDGYLAQVERDRASKD
jgi:hypothetical protein